MSDQGKLPPHPDDSADSPKQTSPLSDISFDDADDVPAVPSPICPECGHVNRAGILVCENCGTLLLTGKVSGTKQFEGEEKKDPSAEQNQAAAVTESQEVLQAAMNTAGTGQFVEGMVLRLEIEGAPTPIILHPKEETNIGRRDPATGALPDVDLTTYAGYRLGVSRRHAVIYLKDKQLEISDLGSSNGTSVNGARLKPHNPHPLRDGDEVMLGKMSIRVLFQSRTRRRL